jgi:hypothetical protein
MERKENEMEIGGDSQGGGERREIDMVGIREDKDRRTVVEVG